MFVAKWKPGLQPEIPELTSAPVWLDFHNVPPQFYSEEGLEHIAGVLGDPLFLHPATANMTNLEVARVFTIINPSKPLPEAINVRFDSGHVERVEVSSPWLPPTCEHCKEVGHSIKSCPTAPITCPTCQSSGHKSEDCPRAKKPATPKEGEAKTKKKKKKKAKFPKPAADAVSKEANTEANIEGNLIIDIGLDDIGENISNEKDIVATNPSKERTSDDESHLSADSEPEEPPSEDEAETSSSDEEGESSESLSSDDSGFSLVTSKKTKKQQRKKEKQAAQALKAKREKELSRSKSSKTRNL